MDVVEAVVVQAALLRRILLLRRSDAQDETAELLVGNQDEKSFLEVAPRNREEDQNVVAVHRTAYPAAGLEKIEILRVEKLRNLVGYASNRVRVEDLPYHPGPTEVGKSVEEEENGTEDCRIPVPLDQRNDTAFVGDRNLQELTSCHDHDPQ